MTPPTTAPAAPSDEGGGGGERAGDGTAASDAPGTVSWSLRPTDTLAGRLCVYAHAGWFGGFAVLVGGLGVAVVAASVAAGDAGTLALVALLVLVGGPFSVVALASFLDRDQRPDLPGAFGRIRTDDLHPVAVAASALLGAAGLVGAFATGSALAWPALVGVLFLANFGLDLAGPEGAVDRDAGTLTVYDRTHALADLTSIRAVELGGIAFVRPRFAPTPGGRDAPWLFAMPADAHRRVAAAFERGVAADVDAPDASSRGERLGLAVAGLASLSLAAGLAYLGATSATDGSEVLYAVASFPVAFGVLFLAMARRRNA